MKLTLPVVRYRVKGIHKDEPGNIVVPNRIIAKASRVELASKWFSPPPEKLLNELLAQGAITNEEAELAKHIPMAQDLTVEADSGGHTDNRPAITLLPTMLALRDQYQKTITISHHYVSALQAASRHRHLRLALLRWVRPTSLLAR